MKITITGPRSVGKSTISKIVAKKINLKYISSDQIGEEAFKEHGGLDKVIKNKKIDKLIEDGAYNLIRNVYSEEDNFVFDLSGGSVTSKKFEKASEKVRKTAKENSIVIGLLPSKNSEESIKILFNREKNRNHFKNMDKKELLEKTKKHFKKFPNRFKDFCNYTIYTKDKSPEEISNQIIDSINQ